MATDPFSLFDEWFAHARASEPDLPEAMSVATADAAGQPSSRMVLLKDYGPDGFVFYTNVESAKGDQLRENPRAALLFHWKSLRRQVRIEGMAEAVGEGEADAYFASRARDSQLGAWASDQSRPMENRERFEQRFEELERKYAGQDVPRPPFWSGYRIVPNRIEFWTERPYRLHERRRFQRHESGWTDGLLYP
jgi:pyridoxamine 5'-phosphate oxidase